MKNISSASLTAGFFYPLSFIHSLAACLSVKSNKNILKIKQFATQYFIKLSSVYREKLLSTILCLTLENIFTDKFMFTISLKL